MQQSSWCTARVVNISSIYVLSHIISELGQGYSKLPLGWFIEISSV